VASPLVTRVVTDCHSLVTRGETREVTAFDTRTRVVLTASRDGFFITAICGMLELGCRSNIVLLHNRHCARLSDGCLE
jgi:hypothetical protein